MLKFLSDGPVGIGLAGSLVLRSLRALRHYTLAVHHAPAGNFVDDRFYRPAVFGELVFDGHGLRVEHAAGDQPVHLHIMQLLGKHLGRDAVHFPQQVHETHFVVQEQGPQDVKLPFSGKDLHGVLNGEDPFSALLGGIAGCLFFHLLFVKWLCAKLWGGLIVSNR